jgi:predicted GNAT family N-acyltransferase
MTRIELMDWNRARPHAAPIRETVFVREQRVPAEIEMDAMDAQCLHAVAYDGARAIATGRLLPDGHVGRMAVLREWRGKGVGGALLQRLVEAARRRGDAEIVLSAQTHALAFYRAHGFVERGPVYVEAGIDHQDMAMEPKAALLAEAARVAAPLSNRHCGELPYGGHCGRTHGSWSLLKLLKQVGTPATDAAFYRGVFSALAPRAEPVRVLVSGTSDYGILEQVVAAAGGRALEATVTDACETPLEMNRWYAARAGLEITTRRCNILEFTDGRPFDLVFAHGFIEQLPADRRAPLAALWHRLLVPGGQAVIVSMIRTEAEAAQEKQAQKPDEEQRALIARVNATLAPALRLPVEDTLERLRRWTAYRMPSDLRSQEEIVGMLEGAGFRVTLAGEGYADTSGRGGSGVSRRIRLTGRR